VSAAVQPTTAPAEELVEVLRRDDVTASLAWIDASEDRAVDTLVSLASIVSPSGQERERARWVAERMRAIGLDDVSIDAASNVVGRIGGRSGSAVVFVTILDDLATIEALQRAAAHPPHRQGDRVVGPATEVQSVNAATLLAAEALVRAGVVPGHDLVIASVAQEETGLEGMKILFDTWKDRAVAWVEVLGDGEEIVYGAGTIHWWKIVANGPGGHTEQGALPNVNQGIARAVDTILSLPHPDRYDDTFLNVGIIQSGEVYNHRPESGWFSLDLRSMEPDIVREIENDIAAVLERVEAETGVRFDMQPVVALDGGQVPGARESRLVRLAAEVSRHFDQDPVVSPRGCCNMSVPVAHGRLAIGLHGERGGQRATAEEWASIPAMMRTAKHVALLAAAY
jgi:acetylornithine deacetylase/succinyl-diaminopimelate desuccinylase-like protein